MSALSSAGAGYGALHLVLPGAGVGYNGTAAEFRAPGTAATSSGANNKRKRRPAGTPDPGAEVVALSPKTLMESDRYVCEICNQGFQRDQNLQMHRRRHKVPWKLLKRPSLGTNKRVYVCPERSCLHHDPAHALGDLVGIKKHYRRKHCTEKLWKCEKCNKGYAVQSDYKAHLKTCGTRGHCCDCGRVFSRVESFIEHQDTCSAVKHKANTQSGDRGSDRAKTSSAPALPQGTTDRNSTESPSQSSDTTQAMSFAHSGMSDTAARSSAEHTKAHADEHSRRIQPENIQATPSQHQAAMPAWLRDRNALELLAPTPMIDYSKPQATRSIGFPSVSCPAPEPSLQLSMGPYGAEGASDSVLADTKPSFSSVLRQTSVIVPVTAPPAAAAGKRIVESPDHGAVGFLIQRLGPERNVQASNTNQQQQQQHVNSTRTEMVANYNPCGSTSSCHEDLAANVHESGADAQGPWAMSRRGFTNSEPSEPATSSAISCRQALLDHRDTVAEDQDHSFAAKPKSMPEDDFRSSQKHKFPGMIGSAHFAEPHQASDLQARTDMNATWSELARARQSRDVARQECEEAQRDIARAEALKREAREQLQFAAAERAYADRARELAKRQIELAEAELARAKRLREHSHSELAAASSPAGLICVSCKSALEPNVPPRSSPVSSTSWPFMTTPANSSDQAMRGGTGMNLWPVAGYRSMSTSLNPVGDSTSSRAQSDRNIITPKLDLDLN